MDFLKPYSSYLLSILRFMSGLLLLQHGTSKFLYLPVGPLNNVQLASLYGIAGLFELICSALLVVGLFTRPVAFLLSGVTALGYFIVHAPRGFFPLLNNGELPALYAFVFIYLAAAGGGPWSLDETLLRRNSKAMGTA